MANAESRNRKRAHADAFSQEHPPNKRAKSRGGLHPREPSNFPPEFYDNLSKVWLTRRALRELDRRNNAKPPPALAASAPTTDLARFARHGGPDLHHLRGCPEPKGAADIMASRRPASLTSVSKTRASSAYDDGFEQNMIDHNIYPPLYDFPNDRATPTPDNLDEHRQVLATSRPSLSPSQFTESKFRNFLRKNETPSEGTIMRNVIPIITGDSDIPNEGNLPFTNIKSITGGATIKAVPDFFDGASPEDVDKVLRDDLSQMIIPIKHVNAPVATNFFLEVKAPSGRADVARRQALHYGAIGARAMHALQNYGAGEPTFDGNAYTYSSIYFDGALKLYTHHVTPPTAPGRGAEYHMSQIKAFALTSDRDAFIQGATAFRNARDLAQRYRDSFIRAANARVRQSDVETPPEAEIIAAVGDEESTNQFVDCEDFPSQLVGTEDHTTPGDVDEGPLQYLCTEDEEPSQESTSFGAEPATSLAMGFTSSFSQAQTRSKRTRASRSPPSNSQPHKKHGSAKRTR